VNVAKKHIIALLDLLNKKKGELGNGQNLLTINKFSNCLISAVDEIILGGLEILGSEDKLINDSSMFISNTLSSYFIIADARGKGTWND